MYLPIVKASCGPRPRLLPCHLASKIFVIPSCSSVAILLGLLCFCKTLVGTYFTYQKLNGWSCLRYDMGPLVKWKLEQFNNQEVVGSNPGTLYSKHVIICCDAF